MKRVNFFIGLIITMYSTGVLSNTGTAILFNGGKKAEANHERYYWALEKAAHVFRKYNIINIVADGGKSKGNNYVRNDSDGDQVRDDDGKPVMGRKGIDSLPGGIKYSATLENFEKAIR